MIRFVLALFCVALPFNTLAFVSDYEIIQNEISKIKEQENSASYDKIEKFFSSDPLFQSHCYQQSYTQAPESLLGLVPSSRTRMNRQVAFLLAPLRYGYEILVQFQGPALEPTTAFEQSLECLPSETGCSEMVLQKNWTLSSDLLTEEKKRDPIEVKETWRFYLSEKNKVFAESSFQMMTKKRNWIGAPVGRETLRLNYTCALEKINRME